MNIHRIFEYFICFFNDFNSSVECVFNCSIKLSASFPYKVDVGFTLLAIVKLPSVFLSIFVLKSNIFSFFIDSFLY